jgi:hypothetical protein
LLQMVDNRSFHKRLWHLLPRAAPILTVTLMAALLSAGGTAAADRVPTGVIVVQGETPTRSDIPIAADPRASGGKYLALDAVQAPPDGGWYATYRVAVPAAGVYHLDAVLTSPAMADRDPKGGSWFDLSVNGAPYDEVAKSEPAWADPRQTPTAWGSLVHARIGDVELRKGSNTISFRVVEPRVSTSPIGYRFLLDVFTLTPTRVALASVYLGNPATNLGIYRNEREQLYFRLNGHAPPPQTVTYRILDYFSRAVAAGPRQPHRSPATSRACLPGCRSWGRPTVSGSPPRHHGSSPRRGSLRSPGRCAPQASVTCATRSTRTLSSPPAGSS